jgi:uncharacterized protein (TIGR02466 family)
MENFITTQELNSTYNVSYLFPTPVLHTKLGREFTPAELTFFTEKNEDRVKNVGNEGSADNFVLHDPALKELHNNLQAHLNFFMGSICCPKADIQVYITQSWFNYTEKGQSHHNHVHTNSWLSGCLYLTADMDSDSITFYRKEHAFIDRFSIPPKTHNPFNAQSWKFPVATGDIILFPSSLQHGVSPLTNDTTRVSLSFNTFIKGQLGGVENLSHLAL